MSTHDYPMYDLDKIEREAHRLRAEMLSNAIIRLNAWVKSRFTTRPSTQAHSA